MLGQYATVKPLDAAAHGDVLYEESSGCDRDNLWLYLWEGPFPDRASFNENLKAKAESLDSLYIFAIIEYKTGLALGHAAYLRIEPVHRVIEVGAILYTPKLQRTAAGTEAVYLIAKHAFENFGYRRYEWKCNSLNARSRAAASRFGFTFEEVFRRYMVIKAEIATRHGSPCWMVSGLRGRRRLKGGSMRRISTPKGARRSGFQCAQLSPRPVHTRTHIPTADILKGWRN